ncbi:phytoene dehydrogenase [Gordonibacter sp. An230]|nr:phytoene dehydrogenase [Gordonibacter sp. An230]
MREKVPKVVATFTSTGDALAVEAAAREGGVPGRMIPVPAAVSAGCGLAWCVDARERGDLERALEERALPFEALHEVELY